jgi:hypothetical protein
MKNHATDASTRQAIFKRATFLTTMQGSHDKKNTVAQYIAPTCIASVKSFSVHVFSLLLF